jgi:hypothetical protein
MSKKTGCKKGEIKIDGKCFKKNDTISVINHVLNKMGYDKTASRLENHTIDEHSDAEGYLNLKTKDLVIVEYSNPPEDVIEDLVDDMNEANYLHMPEIKKGD